MEDRQIKKLDEFMDGALTERFNHAMNEVMRNVSDPNTDPKARRKVVISIEVTPNERRDTVTYKTTVESKIAPRIPITQVAFLRVSDDGAITVREVTSQIPGQISMEGTEQALPNILKFEPSKKAQEQ